MVTVHSRLSIAAVATHFLTAAGHWSVQLLGYGLCCELLLPLHLATAGLLARRGQQPTAALVVAAGLHLLTAAQQWSAEGRILAEFNQLLGPAADRAADAADASSGRLSAGQLGWPISLAQSSWLRWRDEVPPRPKLLPPWRIPTAAVS